MDSIPLWCRCGKCGTVFETAVVSRFLVPVGTESVRGSRWNCVPCERAPVGLRGTALPPLGAAYGVDAIDPLDAVTAPSTRTRTTPGRPRVDRSRGTVPRSAP